MKSKKSALLLSFTSLLLCFAMLVGSTFAWFTDTATTGVNKIVAGKLKVDIVDAEDTSKSLTGEGGKLLWTQKVVSGSIETLEAVETEGLPLWEPGVNFLTQGFKIANKGNLALKWKVEVNKGTTAANAGDYDLLDVIDFYVVTKTTATGEPTETPLAVFEGQLKEGNTVSEATYYIKGHMQESAGNNYQSLTLDGITVTVYATQLNHENDSIGPDYDEKAEYPASAAAIKEKYGVDGMKMPAGVEIVDTGDRDETFVITLKDEEAFIYFTQVFDRAAAFEAREAAWGTEGFTKYPTEYNLASLNMWYGSYCNRITVKMGCDVDLNNMSIKPFDFNGYNFNFDGDGHTIKNAKLTAASGQAGFFGARINIKNVTLDNIHISATGCDSAGVVAGSPNSIIDHVTVKNSSVTGAKYTGAIAGYDYGDVTNCTVENTVVTGQYKAGGIVGYICGEDNEYRTVTGNKLTDVTVKGENIWAGKEENGFILGKIVGNWNAIKGVCKENTFAGTTDVTRDIGEIETRVTRLEQ